MNNLKKLLNKKIMQLVVVLAALFVTVATVYALAPAISLNSPTSFPVDI